MHDAGFMRHGRLWRLTKDPDVKKVALTLVDDPDNQIRHEAVTLLYILAPDNPDLFDALARLAIDGNSDVRMTALLSMPHFGKHAVPILRNAYGDVAIQVRRAAAMASGRLREDAWNSFRSCSSCKMMLISSPADLRPMPCTGLIRSGLRSRRFGLTDASPGR
ncbi:MAG: hypothetical protein EXR98_14155 [Gemmataceae bacterium]|nr:hypothetical protein [Gemmataceae bacterium]